MRPWSRAFIAAVLAVACLQTGCMSPKYKFADKHAPPARALNISFPPAPVEAVLQTAITSGGPGSWKREAYWDEYVLTFHNQGDQPLQIDSVTLAGDPGISRNPGDDPWTLERASKDLEQQYRDTGTAFARMAAPRIFAATAEPGIITGAGIGSAGAAAAATTTAVALPVYGLTMWGINKHNKAAIKAEFVRRRLPLPLNLAPGETRTGSLFFPMIADPRSLSAAWSTGSDTGDSVLSLDFLRGLHLKESTAEGAQAPGSP